MLILCLATFLLFGCNMQKNTVKSRAIQNFTAKYNYLYNAKLQLQFYEEKLQHQFPFNHQHVLPLYLSPLDTLSGQPTLDQVILKARHIISEKRHSNYIPDAYLLLAKAHYLKSNYFLAEAYNDYIIKNYADNIFHLTAAMSGKARALLQLGPPSAAKPVIDDLENIVKRLKKPGSAPLVTLAQYYIFIQQYPQAVYFLERALTAHPRTKQVDIWQYVLGQLHEQQKNYPQALQHYSNVKQHPALYFKPAEFQTPLPEKPASVRSILKNSLLDPDDSHPDTTAAPATLRKG